MKTVVIPANLNIEELRKQYSTANVKGFKIDKVYVVCDSIYKGTLALGDSNKHRFKDEAKFVPLYSKMLQHWIGAEYYIGIIEWMIAAKIIETDGKYTPGIVSKGFRFTEQYRYTRNISVEVMDNAIYQKRPLILEIGYKMSRRTINLKRWYKGLELCADTAHTINNELFTAGMEVDDKNGTCFIPHRRKKFKKRYIDNSTLIELFQGHLASKHKQDPSGYRLHTGITCLPKEFRSVVRYKGEKLAETDLSCSQLFFTLWLFKMKNWRENKATKGIWEGIGAPRSDLSSLPFFSSSIMLSETARKQASSGIQDDLFFKLVTEGNFYDYFADKLAHDAEFFERFPGKTPRNVIKDLFLQQVYGDPYALDTERPYVFTQVLPSKDRAYRQSNPAKKRANEYIYSAKNTLLWDLFANEMPLVAEMYRYIKAFDNADLAKVLQRIESTAILDNVCKDIEKELGNVPIFTLHDCIVTTESNVGNVDEVLKTSIAKFIGAIPATKIVHWDHYGELLPEYMREYVLAA